MAHEFETGLFVGEPAWHGLGVVLRNPPSVEEAIRAAGLDWGVRLAPLALAEDGRSVDHLATVRETDNSILGVVGPSFVPLQNRDAFAWFQPLVDSGAVSIEAAGSLREGRRIWILAQARDSVADVVPGDAVRQFLLLAHAHDGSLAIRCGFTVVRVVCANTLAGALSDASSKLLKIQHRAYAVEALEKVRAALDLARGEFAATREQLRELARKGCNERTLRRYVREVFEPGRADDEKAAVRTVDKIVPLFESGRGADLPRVRGTFWGAFNAITEYVTHERGRLADARVESAWFGDGARLARRALDVGLEFAAAA
jgi:phage/plasmid-like protein (TIGR03299 family)